MSRINPIDENAANEQQKEQIEMLKKKMGKVPNILGTMIKAPAVFQSYLKVSESLRGGDLGEKMIEHIALYMAGINECHYCACAHTMIAKGAGISSEEAARNIRGESEDEKVKTALEFIKEMIETKGYVSEETFSKVKNAGFSEVEIMEMVAAVSHNTLTNYFNHVADVKIDFPEVEMP